MGVITSPFLELRVRRENLIEDSLSQLSTADRTDLVKELKVQFVGEEGIDEGGVSKEWFQLIVKEIFDPKYGMFIQDDVNRLQWFNGASRDFPEFELIGILLGLAIYNGVILDLHLPVVVYKKLLGHKLTLEDVKQVNPVSIICYFFELQRIWRRNIFLTVKFLASKMFAPIFNPFIFIAQSKNLPRVRYVNGLDRR